MPLVRRALRFEDGVFEASLGQQLIGYVERPNQSGFSRARTHPKQVNPLVEIGGILENVYHVIGHTSG